MQVAGGEGDKVGGGTFRDPAGSVELHEDAVYRYIHPPHGAETLAFLKTSLAAELVEQGRLVSSEIVDEGLAQRDVVLRHPLIPFPSYPWEWSPALWSAAAELTLQMNQELLREGWILKDGTPLNVLFQGMQPVFVDVLSIARVDFKQPIWFAYGQFVRTFLLPMIAYRELGWPLTGSMARRDGYEPEDLFSVLPLPARLRQPALSAITLPHLMAGNRKKGVAPPSNRERAEDQELVTHILSKTFRTLQSQMRRATPIPQASTWTEYCGTATHYEAADHATKKSFVTAVLQQASPSRVLDVGCNSGVYSELAADSGADVVSVDTDLQTIDQLYLRLKDSGKRILPLVVNLANPSPALGWQNREARSFLERCKGNFDLVLMLAVLHHLVLHDQVPLDRVAQFCSGLTTRHLIMEWVPPTDVKFKELVRGREAIFARVTETSFRNEFSRYFRIIGETALLNGRILFHFEKQL